jgi:hypothetical protein
MSDDKKSKSLKLAVLISAVLIKLFSVSICSQSYDTSMSSVSNKLKISKSELAAAIWSVDMLPLRKFVLKNKMVQRGVISRKFDWRRTDTSPLLNKMTLASNELVTCLSKISLDALVVLFNNYNLVDKRSFSTIM